MVTWGDPELSCCDSSTISFITGKQPPEKTVEMLLGAELMKVWLRCCVSPARACEAGC